MKYDSQVWTHSGCTCYKNYGYPPNYFKNSGAVNNFTADEDLASDDDGRSIISHSSQREEDLLKERIILFIELEMNQLNYKD